MWIRNYSVPNRTTAILPQELPAATLAGLLLSAIPVLSHLGLAAPTPARVLEVTNAGRSTAYKVKAVLEASLPEILKPSGRPPSPPPAPRTDDPCLEISRKFLDYTYSHPGCVTGSPERRRYSDGFRHYALDLAAASPKLSLEAFAEAISVPLPTLKDWLSGEMSQVDPEMNLSAAHSPDPTLPQIETLLTEWARWNGTFKPFCRHVQFNLRLPFGVQLISDLLALHGVRHPRRRDGRSPDEVAIRDQFEAFFPNAQWVGDGKQIKVQVDDQVFVFNLELNVDTCSAALVGAAVTPTEDAEAVVLAFNDGVATTGEPPIAELLDNKPSNHTAPVVEALGDTLLIRATIRRPEGKGHVEGAFGLFEQALPPIELQLTSPEDLARQVLELQVISFARTLNYRPRKARGGKSRVELHRDHVPTPEEIAAAKAALKARLEKQEQARKTLASRQDPEKRELIQTALRRIGLEDPESHFLTAIARYPLEAILEGFATFEGKMAARTLPDGVDARYLLGIVRNIAEEREGLAIADALLAARIEFRDKTLSDLEKESSRRLDEFTREELLIDYVDHALKTGRIIDRLFWLDAAAGILEEVEDTPQKRHLLGLAAKRIHTTYAVPHKERLSMTRFLFSKAVLVA